MRCAWCSRVRRWCSPSAGAVATAYNPLSPAAWPRIPIPIYAAIRERNSVHRSRLLGMPGCLPATRMSTRSCATTEGSAATRERRCSHAGSARLLPPDEELTMLTLDPPDHTRLRALVNKAFTRSAICATRSADPEHPGVAAGRHQRPFGVRSHGGGRAPTSRDRDRRDAGDRPPRIGPGSSSGRPSARASSSRR